MSHPGGMRTTPAKPLDGTMQKIIRGAAWCRYAIDLVVGSV